VPGIAPPRIADTTPSAALPTDESTARATRDELAARDAIKTDQRPALILPTTQPPPPAPPKVIDEPSIQIASDLLDDLERVVSNDRTYVRPNPFGPTSAPAAPAAPKRRVEDERTDPHIRVPQK
jgi:hypothetical protein